MELDDKIYNEIVALSEQGNECVESDDFREAIKLYEKALDLLPNPKENFEAATWLYASLGDTYFLDEDYNEAINALEKAKLCPDGLENPFIHLRLGESYFETDNLPKAKESLLMAYALDGDEIFEDEDEKYLTFLNEKSEPQNTNDSNTTK